MPTEPPDCPCFTAPCRVHTEEGKCPRRWPGASKWTLSGGGGGGGDLRRALQEGHHDLKGAEGPHGDLEGGPERQQQADHEQQHVGVEDDEEQPHHRPVPQPLAVRLVEQAALHGPVQSPQARERGEVPDHRPVPARDQEGGEPRRLRRGVHGDAVGVGGVWRGHCRVLEDVIHVPVVDGVLVHLR